MLVIWAESRGIDLLFIQRSNPQQNAYIERYNRTVRYDWLSHYLFAQIKEAQDYATRWLWRSANAIDLKLFATDFIHIYITRNYKEVIRSR